MHAIRADDGSGNIECSLAPVEFTALPMNFREIVASTPEILLLAQSPVPRARKLRYPKSRIVEYVQINMKRRN
jgi:hypothetical protein